MRIRIRHKTTYTYAQAAQSVIQILHMTPRNHDGQFVRRWQIEIDRDGLLRPGEDAFGNITHMLTLAGPIESLTLSLDGEVDTQDTTGLVRATLEKFPPRFYLRETPLTVADAALKTFAHDVTAGAQDELSKLHALLDAVFGEVVFDTVPTDAATSAAQAFAIRRGVCQDLTHIFIAAARRVGIPARYIGGHLYRADMPAQVAGHAWAEAFVTGFGWVAFDPTNGICPTDAHVRISVGLDYLGAAPVRGAQFGGGTEAMTVEIGVERAPGQTQSQSQS